MGFDFGFQHLGSSVDPFFTSTSKAVLVMLGETPSSAVARVTFRGRDGQKLELPDMAIARLLWYSTTTIFSNICEAK